jgi:hypothetical protein
MAKFKGKNAIDSIGNLARERARYKSEAFPENGGLGPKQIMDFNFAERVNYGRVDRQHNPIYPISDFLVPLQSSNNNTNTLLAMNYVSDQYRDLEEHFVKACRLALIPKDDPILSRLTAVRAYLDPLDDYIRYRDSVMDTFIDEFISSRNYKVNNFDDFVVAFTQYMSLMRDIYPITFSGYQRSNQGSIFSSGLAIDIAGIPFDDDEQKQTLLFDSPAFLYYLNLAKQYGFSVNKRNPGVLISDVASPVTTIYRGKYNLSSVDLIFSEQFQKTLYRDLELFTNTLADYYNFYISRNPFKRAFHTSWSLKTITVVEQKKQVDINNISNVLYNNIINLYIITRNIEERLPYSNTETNNIYKNAIQLKKVSENTMLEYIDDQFKLKYNEQNGFLSYHRKKLKKRLDKE